MATVSFLWHLHQPAYRTADGVAHAPWVLLHAGGAYLTLARAISETGGGGQVVNIVPTLLEQMLAYRDGTVVDPVADLLTTPAENLTTAERRSVVEWASHVNPRQLARFEGLARAAGSTGGRPAAGTVRELQVLTLLAHAGDSAWRDPELAELSDRGGDFSRDDHARISRWLREQPERLISHWRRIAGLPGVEIATSPYAHPIIPLLIDTGVVRDSWAPQDPPPVPSFRHPEDARRQIDDGLSFMRRHGFEVSGCWPPEGAVSAEALAAYAAAGVRWLATDEGILERSLGEALRDNGAASAELYRPWRGPGASPHVYFRDRELSDRIGFVYGSWDDEGIAALDLVRRLRELAATLPEEAAIVIALDGENPWPHYERAGGDFLRVLLAELAEPTPELAPATLSELTDRLEPAPLPRVHPGSWIHAVFATWIGHPEKTAAWELLTRVREAVPDHELPPGLLLAEGSDWFWWLGEDNPTELAPLYDEIFRRHLADGCAQAGVAPPVDLDRPLRRAP
jgi:alpha-amylase/alpha-mannosidase (GH57 family)